MNILVIDAGTSGMRGILYREDMKKLFSCGTKYRPECGAAGELRQKAEEFENALLTIVRSVCKNAGEQKKSVDVIAVTAQRSSVIPVDGKGKPLTEVIMWQDTGNRGICKELEKYNTEIAKRSGACVNTVFSGGKMAWLKRERPEIMEKAHKLVNIPEYLLHCMTGRYVTDYTYGSRSNLMNLKECRWDKELLAIFGIKEKYLCELLPPGSLCGNITESFARRTGLKENIPVITAGGDQQCAAVGQGIWREGEMSVVAGTGAFLTAVCSRIPADLPSGFICNYSAIEGKYIIEANVLACCSAFDWFCRNFYENGKKEKDYVKINHELEAIYGKEEECIVLPYFQGRSAPQWNAGAVATIHNITLATTRAELLKALLEGIFLEVKNNMDLLGNYIDIDSVYISGGLTKSPVINQMQADIYGRPLYCGEDPETTALGALMVALHALGIYSSYEELVSQIRRMRRVERIEPKRTGNYYRNKQREMNRLYEKIYT